MTLLLGFAAVNTGNNLLYLLVSALLGFMAVSGVLGRWNLAGLGVRVEVPDEVYDGVSTLLTVRIENRKRLLPVCLVDVLLPAAGQATFIFVERGGTASETLTATFHGRGIHTLAQAQVRSIFPINFFVRSFPVPVDRKLTVFPTPRPCRLAGEAGRQTAGGELPVGRKGYEGELSRISDYHGGEPLKLIHWKLSARHGQLKVKELSDAARPPVTIELDFLPGRLEERLRCAAYLADSYLRENRPVGLRLGSRTLPPAVGRAHKLRLLTELAVHGQG
ncbi:MAG TPA: DUF58 domain-containing protein [Desulfuromonadales bacterium]|jgi:uncharacterized protein (DUF58 family)